MKISNSDLKEILNKNEIDEDKQASIINDLETKEIIAETKAEKAESKAEKDKQELKNQNNVKIAEKLGYKR